YNNPNAHDTLDVYGVISCMPQVEGSIPEILLQFSHSETKTDGAQYQVYVQLKLNNTIKNLFRQLEVHIQLQRHIKTIKSKQSVGNTKARSSNVLVWNIGSKFPTSSLEAVLNCMVKLAKEKPKSEDDDVVNISEEWSNLFATVQKLLILVYMNYLQNKCSPTSTFENRNQDISLGLIDLPLL
ncbi:unnamed protein product, partial [Timema podura]|nr:unnamed protein product [Timema podura]